MAQNTISQLERGEREAMPSTVRKLADALGVEPTVLMAEPRIDVYMPREQQAVEQKPVSSLPSEDRETPLSLEVVKGFIQGAAAHLGLESAVADTILEFTEALHKEEARARKEWYETGRWAEYYVSGEYEKWVSAFAETHDMSTLLAHAKLWPVLTLLFNPEEIYLQGISAALRSHTKDLDNVRLRLSRNDPKESLQAAQLVSDRARKIVEEHARCQQSFLRIPDHYYADSAAHSRILKLEEALSEQYEVARDAVTELNDLYDESLDTLEDQILEMRKESDVLEEFVTQAHDSER